MYTIGMTLEYIISKLIEYFPQIAGYSLIAIIVGFVCVKATQFYMRTNGLHSSVGGLGASMTAMKTTLDSIHTGLTTHNNVLLEKTVISTSCYSVGNSPRVLNDRGIKLYEKSGAKILLEKKMSELIKELELKAYNSFLEVERESFKALLNRMSESDFYVIQDFAYQHPQFEDKSLTYSDILYVMSIVLRDAYKTKHPELNLKDE